MTREIIPKKTKDALLVEFSHRCAICGGDHPHIHHIDEDPSNNDLSNLLPLCPNCHLRDQHNPTRKFDVPKLKLFRRHKDPAVLKPQFHPIYARQQFLESVEPGCEPTKALEAKAKELSEFVEVLEMGSFYAKRLIELIGPLRRGFIQHLDEGHDYEYERQMREANREYRDKLIANQEAVRNLLVEQLRYQNWANEA